MDIKYIDIFDYFDTPFRVGCHDSVCGLPIDPKLANNEEYLRGREYGEKLNMELEEDEINWDDDETCLDEYDENLDFNFDLGFDSDY